jgi:hypothetical protein
MPTITRTPTQTFTPTLTYTPSTTPTTSATPTASLMPTRTPIPSSTPYLSPTSMSLNCAAAPTNQIRVGDTIIVEGVGEYPLNIRSFPSTNATKIVQVHVGTMVTVIDGPQCGQSGSDFRW